MTKIQITRNYSWFKSISIVDERGSSRKRTQKFSHLSDPIFVNEKYEIIEGQERFQKRKELELPIHYVVIPGLGQSEARVYSRMR